MTICFYDNLKKLMHYSNTSVTQLSTASKIDYKHLQRLIRDKDAAYKLDTILILANYYGLSLDALIMRPLTDVEIAAAINKTVVDALHNDASGV